METDAGRARSRVARGASTIDCDERRRPFTELREFEETCGEFSGFEVKTDRALVMLRDTHTVIVPLPAPSALRALRKLTIGERVAILRMDYGSDAIRVRKVSPQILGEPVLRV